jgi:hypothetical protein
MHDPSTFTRRGRGRSKETQEVATGFHPENFIMQGKFHVTDKSGKFILQKNI